MVEVMVSAPFSLLISYMYDQITKTLSMPVGKQLGMWFWFRKFKKSVCPEYVMCPLKVLTAFQPGQTFSEQDLWTRNLKVCKKANVLCRTFFLYLHCKGSAFHLLTEI